ncbi:Polyamine aminopropyltransferase [Chlorella vulgaris]
MLLRRKKEVSRKRTTAVDNATSASTAAAAAPGLRQDRVGVAPHSSTDVQLALHPGPASGQLLAAATAVLALLLCQHAAVRLLAPQTGEWLAASFCSLALLAIAVVAAVAGHAADDTIASVAAASTAADRSASSSSAVTAWAWFGASIAAASLSVRWHGSTLVGLAGSWLLAPGLADSPGLRISDAELTLRCMALAAATCGPLFACLGLAAGAGCSAALRTELPARGRLSALVAALAAAASWALLQGLPPAVLPPRPASTLPLLVSVAAALLAAILMPAARPVADSAPQGAKPRRSRNGSTAEPKPWVALPWQRRAAVLLGPVALMLLAQLQAHRRGSAAAPRQLEGGRYHVLWQTELAAGGQLSVIEGVYREQYRYRLLRLDHSVLGGEYVAPAEVAGQTIYTAFYLQQAAVLLRPGGSRSLHVGLGVGTAVKGMQRLGVAADSLELHPEVLAAARRFFQLQPELGGGRALLGDAAALVPLLQREGGAGAYDYILHDVFSGGGTAPSLMSAAFFRKLSRLLAPGGVLAVNYYGGKGQGLKQAWCRLRLVFDSVRAFSDTDKARVRNHVLFASHADLAAANLTAAVEAVQAASAARYSSSGGTEEMLDPLQLRVWSGLPGREVQLMFDRQRCQQMLTWHEGLPAGRSTAGNSQGNGGGSGGSRLQLKGQPPLLWRKLREMRERHALATAHWVVARIQFADSLWLS